VKVELVGRLDVVANQKIQRVGAILLLVTSDFGSVSAI